MIVAVEVVDNSDLEENSAADGEDQERKRQRELQLGFKPQKELLYNQLLPYNETLDNEAKAWYGDIKANLSKALALRELRPGFITWASRFHSFHRLYGFCFPKGDHVALINMLYEFVTDPDIADRDPSLLEKAGNVLIKLLKRRELLEPSDLALEWRPLYVVYEKLLYSPYNFGMFRIRRENIEGLLR